MSLLVYNKTDKHSVILLLQIQKAQLMTSSHQSGFIRNNNVIFFSSNIVRIFANIII